MILNITGRLSFEHVFQPGTDKDGKNPSFSATILMPKNDPQIATLQKAIADVATQKWGPKTQTVLNRMVGAGKVLLRDGDLAEYDGYAGMCYVAARNPARPAVFNRRCEPVAESDGLIYSGCYVVARIELWAQDNNFGQRVNAKLLGIQFVKDGDRFGNGSGPAKATDFADLGDDSDATTMPMMGQPVAQPAPQPYPAQPVAQTYPAQPVTQVAQPAAQDAPWM